MVKWLRICLPLQGTWVQSLVQEDSSCCGAPKLMCHNHRACALQQEKPPQEAHAPQLEKARSQQRRPSTAKNNSINKQTKELSRDYWQSSSQDSSILLQGEWVPVMLSSDRRRREPCPEDLAHSPSRGMASTCPFLDGSTEGAVQWLLDMMLSSTHLIGLIIWDPYPRRKASVLTQG